MERNGRNTLVGLGLLGMLLAAGSGRAAVVGTELISLSQGGTQVLAGSAFDRGFVISGDGRYVVFVSTASTLVPGDTNGVADVFLRDREGGTTERISLSSGGAQGNGACEDPTISPDGRFVAFVSAADNLVPGDGNGVRDVFIRDLQGGTTERVSVSGSGAEGNGASESPALSADGRFVAFVSAAANLSGPDHNGTDDIYLRDRVDGTTERISINSVGTEANGRCWAPSMNADGRLIAFASSASNLASGDTNNAADIFTRNRSTGFTERVSVGERGVQSNGPSDTPVVSATGRYVAFSSRATSLVQPDINRGEDVFVRDRLDDVTEIVSVTGNRLQARGNSFLESMSADGRFVAFRSYAANLVPRDTNRIFDLFVRDRREWRTERVNVGAGGSQANGHSYAAALSANGQHVAYWSTATNLVAGDTNGAADVFTARLLVNQPPTANAGPDQTLISSRRNLRVRLDGTASTDPEGGKLRYTWTEGRRRLSTRPNPRVRLRQGIHEITLTVKDPSGATATDTVTITIQQ